MIIECPVCTTRYNVQAVFPPEGRPVRCAKCGNVWRAMAIDENAVESAASDTDEQADVAPARENVHDRADTTTWAGGDTASAEESEQDNSGSSYDQQPQDGLYRENPYAGSDTYADGPEDRGAVENGEDAQQHSAWSWRSQSVPSEEPDSGATDFSAGENDPSDWRGNGSHADTASRSEDIAEDARAAAAAASDETTETPADAAEHQPAALESDADGGGKVRWFGRFRKNARNGSTDAQREADAASDTKLARGTTIPFPAAVAHTEASEADGPQAAGFQDETFRSLEDARAAVRGVFASLSEARTDQTGAAIHASPILSSASSPAAETAGSARRASAVRAGAGVTHGQNGSADQEAYGPHSSDRAYFRQSYRTPDDQDEATDSESGQQSRDAETWADGAEDTGERLARELQDKLSTPRRPPADTAQDAHEESARRLADSLWQRPKLPLNDLDGPTPDDNDPADRTDAALADAALEERLAREIEGRRQHRLSLESAQDENTKPGGLVVAAAWGLFLCAVAGLAVAFVSFRDAIADALPGAAPIYRALGTPVTVQPLVFDNVQYKWALSDSGKPMLVVSGSIVNRAQRKVPVPLLYVSVQDKDPAASREFRTLIQTDRNRLRRGEKADFAIELVGPRPTITAVELEIRNIR
jgi:predicted Zn finger-like uncharacterized protein